MRINRRNVLLGLGTMAVGGGAVAGSGAFSQVEADRTVSVSTANDDSALLSITGNDGDYFSEDGTGGAIEVDIQDLNDDAKTVFEGLITVTNNGNNDVGVWVTLSDGSDLDFLDEDGESIVGGAGSSTDIGTTESENLDVVFETGDRGDADTVTEVTFHADENEYDGT